jgi:hypothetical protein
MSHTFVFSAVSKNNSVFVFSQCRGERANGGHLREMQDKTKNIQVETLYKLAFSLKGLVLKYAV